MFRGDYHTHTVFSDGKGTVYENAVAAKEKGLLEVAITDHGFNIPTMSFKKYSEAKDRCKEAEDSLGIRVISGIEANLISLEGDIDITEKELRSIDYLTVGFHKFAWFNGLKDFMKMYAVTYFNGLLATSEKAVERNTRAMISAIDKYPIKVITHVNHSLKVDVRAVAAACAAKDVLIEINVKHLRDLEGQWEYLAESGARFIVNSDAHTPAEVGVLTPAFDAAVAHGIEKERIVNYYGE